MAKLSTATRNKLPKKSFAGPGRSFPVNDAVHARMAISGATRSEHAGNISASEAAHIKSIARSKLGQQHKRPMNKHGSRHTHHELTHITHNQFHKD